MALPIIISNFKIDYQSKYLKNKKTVHVVLNKNKCFDPDCQKRHFHQVINKFNLNNGPIRIAWFVSTWPYGNN